MPAILFNLWNPHVAADGAATFEVTQADTFRLNRGSQELIDAALAALHLEAACTGWDVTAGRSRYYSDDPNHPDWRARWVRTWQIRVKTELPLVRRHSEVVEGTAELELSDNTWPDDDDAAEASAVARQDRTSFVIVDFQKAREEVVALAEAAWSKAGLRAPVTQELREFADDVCQLYAVIDEHELSTDASALDGVLEELKRSGGAINWRTRLGWRPPPPLALRAEISAWMTSLGRAPDKS
jgi:hypothetical protein